MWAMSLKRNQCITCGTSHDVGALLGMLALCGYRNRCPHNPHPTVFPTPLCSLQRGQFLARHFDALLECAVAHHLALHLIHAVNHRGMIAPAERLPNLDQL